MNIKTKLAALAVLVIFSVIYMSCNGSGLPKQRELISFKAYNGISYSEVARRQKNGLSFNEYGYQLEPQWKLKFVSDDSISIYSPTKKAFINFFLTRGYDSIFNAARSWLKVKKISEDSIIMEIIKSQGDSLDIGGSKVYMVFYADNYTKNVLHLDTATLRHPSRKDSVFIRGLAAKANADYTKAFAARQPVKLISKSPQVKVEQHITKPEIDNNFDTSDDYLDPTFYITINKTYKDFYYSFTVYVDDKGIMHYGIPLVGLDLVGPEYKADYIRLSTAVMDSYLKYYLQIIPGSTLGMLHSSMISLHVEGKMAAAGKSATIKK